MQRVNLAASTDLSRFHPRLGAESRHRRSPPLHGCHLPWRCGAGASLRRLYAVTIVETGSDEKPCIPPIVDALGRGC